VSDAGPEPPRFIADAMLGRLARWLRLLGCDTVYDPHLDDPAIAARAVREGRIVLTRDHGLLERRLVRRGLLVSSGDLGEQLRQVLLECGVVLARERMFTVCVACNGALAEAQRQDVAGRVPPIVLRTHERFRACVACGRVYWSGTHVARALEHVERLTGARIR
jgi:uncharacterized protein with PIN domain